MTDNVRRLMRMIVSAVLAGIVGAGTNLLTSITSSGEIHAGAWTIATVTFVVLAGQNLQSALSEPPVVRHASEDKQRAL